MSNDRNQTMTVVQALETAAQLHGAGLSEPAERVYRAVLAAAPDTPDAFNLLGALMSEQNAVDTAVALTARALALAPGCAAYCFNAANARRKADDLRAAVAGYRRALRLDPGYARARAALAELLSVTHDEPTLRYAVMTEPENPRAWRLLAEIYAGRDDGRRAAAAAEWAEAAATGQPRRWRLRRIAPAAVPAPDARRLGQRQKIAVVTTEAKPRSIRYDRPEHFIARLEDATILPANLSAATADGGLMLYGMTPYSRPSVGLLNGFGPWLGNGRLLVADPPAPTYITDEAILLGGDGNFAHCLLDWLSRLLVLERAQAQQPELAGLPLLVSDRLPPVITALLERLGYGPRLRPFATARGLRAARLWTPSITHEFQLIDPDWADWLRRRLGLADAEARDDGRRLFLARRHTAHRRLLNEDAVLATLADFGFVPFYAEDWSLDEQLRRLAETRALVSVLGAGMAAVMFAPKGCGVVELTHQHMDLVQYAVVCAVLGQPYRQVIGAAAPYQGALSFDADFSVDPAALRRALQEVA